jgi:hypothetical protein
MKKIVLIATICMLAMPAFAQGKRTDHGEPRPADIGRKMVVLPEPVSVGDVGLTVDAAEIELRNIDPVRVGVSVYKWGVKCRVLSDQHIQALGLWKEKVLVRYEFSQDPTAHDHCPNGGIFFMTEVEFVAARAHLQQVDANKKADAEEREAVEQILRKQ